jgi:hypothetical protein
MDRLVLTRRRDGSLHAEDSDAGGAEDKEIENVVFDRAEAKAVVRICLCICLCVSCLFLGLCSCLRILWTIVHSRLLFWMVVLDSRGCASSVPVEVCGGLCLGLCWYLLLTGKTLVTTRHTHTT